MTDFTAKLQEHRETVKNRAEDLIHHEIPRKIIALNKIIATEPLLNLKDRNKMHQDLGVAYNCVSPFPAIPCNSVIREAINIVKPYSHQLLKDANLLKMWITYLIPKIEDGNNFGVSIQEEMLAEVRSVESQAASYYDDPSDYFSARASYVAKVAKYPYIEDYRIAVEELDEKEYARLVLVLCEIRNSYSILHDSFLKNLEKIEKPRNGSMMDNLY